MGLLKKVLFVAVILFVGSNANAKDAPSFDCSKAKLIIDKTICANSNLAKLDSDMAQLFKTYQSPKFANETQKAASQKEWLRQRNSCLYSKKFPVKSSEIECISLNYKIRIAELAQANIFTNSQLALKMMAEHSPEHLPYYKAILHYFNMPEGIERTEEIEEDLGGEFKKLDTEDSDWVKGLLSDFGINSIADGTKSDDKFGYLVSVLSSLENGPLIIPCDAFRAKPQMISALEPLFGSSRDNFLARSDCEIPQEMVKFKAFLDASFKEAPGCDGTMRFGIYRSRQLQIDVILLGRFQAVSEATNYYIEYLEDNSASDPKFNSFLKNRNALHKAAAKEIKAFWLVQYPENEMRIQDIEDNLAALSLGDFAGC